MEKGGHPTIAKQARGWFAESHLNEIASHIERGRAMSQRRDEGEMRVLGERWMSAGGDERARK